MREPRRLTAEQPKKTYKTPYERIPGTSLPRIPKGTRNVGSGRKPGQQSKITTIVKEAISEGAAACGYDGKGKDGLPGYMRRLAETEAVAFTTLLKAIIPLQLQANLGIQHMEPENGETITMEELEKRLKERGLRPMIDVTPPPPKSPKQIEGK